MQHINQPDKEQMLASHISNDNDSITN